MEAILERVLLSLEPLGRLRGGSEVEAWDSSSWDTVIKSAELGEVKRFLNAFNQGKYHFQNQVNV